MGIQEPELVDLVHKLEDLEQKQRSHRLHNVYIFITHQELSGTVFFFLFLTDAFFAALCLSLVKVNRNYHGTKEKQI